MKDKNSFVLMIVGAVTLIIVTLGATYAYFQAQSNGGANIDTSVITGTTDLLSFRFGDVINIHATEENFAQGMGDLSDSTTGTAILRANNASNEATATYNIYLIIEENDFEYTTEKGTPEILLNVTDPNGNKVENITGLVHYEDGFDITTRTGGFLLVPDYEISATNIETIQDWKIEVTFVNLDSDQQANTNKTLTGKLYMTQEQMSSYELIEINNIDSTTTYNSINATLELTNGSGAVERYYYGIEEAAGTMAYVNNTNQVKRLSNTYAAIEDVKYIESDSPNYEFTNLNSNTEYTIYSYVVDSNNIKSNVYSTNVTTSEYEVPIVESMEHSVTLNSITVTVNASNGSEEIVKYMYSKDNGARWVESESNSYTFSDLKHSTEYDIKVKAVDSNGAESTEYYEAITTEIYILPVVSSVKVTTTWNSITVTPSGTDGTNVIDHYEYSINNGAYQTSNVFNNLTENTTYTVKVKAIDSVGEESNVYSTAVRTDTYTLPTISISTSATTNSITVSVSATPGDGSIVSYHYSRDNGSNYTTSTSNSYTFSGLTAGATYYLKVYVTDSNGRTSAVTSRTQATTYVNPSVSNVTASNITSDSVTIRVTASGGSNSVSRYYFSSNNGSSYVSSTSSSYTFTNLSPGTRYTFRVYVTDTAGHQSSQRTVSATTEDNTFASYIKNLYTSQGSNGLYYHNSSLTNGAGDNSYRYSGANPNNYVCFGSVAATCPNDNLYRIIGVFGNQVKLIKSTYATSSLLGINGAYNSSNYFYWNNDTDVNSWSESNLNIVNLNTNYLNNIGSTWSSKIAEATWQVGGMYLDDGRSFGAQVAYNYELGDNSIGTTYNAKIGLIYVSDYYYGASPTYWSYPGFSFDTSDYGDAKGSNWLVSSIDEWTISRRSDRSDLVFVVNSDGVVFNDDANGSTVRDGLVVRPTFYLNSNVEYESGTGTSSNPYRLS